MTKTYVYPSDTFDSWRTVTNAHSDEIGDIAHRKVNSVAKAASIEQQYYSDHIDLLNFSVASVASNSTVTITSSQAWHLRPGMKVVAYVGGQIVSDDLCAIQSLVINASGAVVTMNIPIVFGPSPNTVIFNFYRTTISDINDLETTKVNRNGDTMTEALTIDSLTTTLGELKTNEVNFNLINANATTVNFAGAGSTINIGAVAGTTTIKNDVVTIGQTTSGVATVNSPVVNISTGAIGVTTIISTKTSTGSANGALVINGGLGVLGTVNVAGITKIENITDVTLGNAATGAVQLSGGLGIAKNVTIGLDLRVSGGDITIEGTPNIQAVTASSAVGLFNTTTGLITIGLNASTSELLNGNITLNTNNTNTVSINGNALTTPNTTFALVNGNVTTLNLAGAATTINVGAATGTTTLTSTTTSTSSANGSVVLNGGIGVLGTMNVAGITKFENITDVTMGTVATGGTQVIGGLSVSKNVTIGQDLRVTGGDITIEGTPNIQAVTASSAVGLFNTTTGLITIGASNVSSEKLNGEVYLNTDSTNTVNINGSFLTTPNLTFSLINTTATTLNIGGAATTISIGAATGTTTVNNDLNVATGKVFKINGTNVLSATTLGVGVLASSLTSVGTLTNLTVAGTTTINGGNLVSGATTSNLFNTTADTLNIGGAATIISIGAATGTTTINNTLVAKNVDFGVSATMLYFNANLATVSETEIFQLDKTVYRSAEVIIQATQGTNYHATKFIMMQDGVDSYESEYGTLGTVLGSYNTSISGNVWSMKATQLAATATAYKIIITAVKV